MTPLRDRLRNAMNGWHSADEFKPNEFEAYLDDLENAVSRWLCDGVNELRKE